jgi:restriction alleviation protein, Lar family
MTDETLRILPCPFCGNAGTVLADRTGSDSIEVALYVGCNICGARGPYVIGDDSPNRAIEEWNKCHDQR